MLRRRRMKTWNMIVIFVQPTTSINNVGKVLRFHRLNFEIRWHRNTFPWQTCKCASSFWCHVHCAINFKMKNLYAMRLCPILMSTIVNFCQKANSIVSNTVAEVNANKDDELRRHCVVFARKKRRKTTMTKSKRRNALYFWYLYVWNVSILFLVWKFSVKYKIWHRLHRGRGQMKILIKL